MTYIHRYIVFCMSAYEFNWKVHRYVHMYVYVCTSGCSLPFYPTPLGWVAICAVESSLQT